MIRRNPSASNTRLSATLLAVGACMGLTVAVGAFGSQPPRGRGPARIGIAVPRLVVAMSAVRSNNLALGAAALALLLVWGLRMRLFAATAFERESQFASDTAIAPAARVAWTRSLHRGGRYGP